MIPAQFKQNCGTHLTCFKQQTSQELQAAAWICCIMSQEDHFKGKALIN